MKADIHPTYHADAKVKCACGNTFVTGSTVKEINVEICSSCHPFFTGSAKLIDTAGRVDKFKERLAQAKARQATATKAKKPAVKGELVKTETPKADTTEPDKE